MKYRVAFRPLAEADLIDLYEFIAAESGTARAGAYLKRLEAACMALQQFPERGTRRDDIRRGLRILGFERRVAILFQIAGRTVTIARILYGGQDYLGALLGPEE